MIFYGVEIKSYIFLYTILEGRAVSLLVETSVFFEYSS